MKHIYTPNYYNQSFTLSFPSSSFLFTPILSPTPGEYKVVCYFTPWAFYRSDLYKYAPENVDPSLCTHIVYAYASLDSTDLIMRSLDPYLDFDYSKC